MTTYHLHQLCKGAKESSSPFADTSASQLGAHAVLVFRKLNQDVGIKIDSGSSAWEVVNHDWNRTLVENGGEELLDSWLVLAHCESKVAWVDDDCKVCSCLDTNSISTDCQEATVSLPVWHLCRAGWSRELIDRLFLLEWHCRESHSYRE